MKILSAIVICCLIYKVSAGGAAFTSEQPVTSPSTIPLCPDCENFYKNAGPLYPDTCDPGSKILCIAEALAVTGDVSTGYCAGTATNPYPASDRSSLFVDAQMYCD
jgi:hypothetical protein